MNRLYSNHRQNVFLGTRALPCPYIDGEIERKVITDLSVPGAGELYDRLSRAGFRRSHSIAYRPACPSCTACKPVRIRVKDFNWSKRFRRTENQNKDLIALEMAAHATEEQFDLFQQYQEGRHSGGEMETMDFREYRAMIEDSPVDSQVIEFRAKETDTLVGFLLADRQSDALSAVYSAYDVNNAARSLGTYMVLWLIKQACERHKPYVYLGYWVESSRKMAYKADFRPIEVFGSNGWTELSNSKRI